MARSLEKVFAMEVGSVYPLLLQKVEKKGRTKEELDEVIEWLTGYSKKEIETIMNGKVSYREFFELAPRLHPNRCLIQGKICGVQIEEIESPLMREIRYLDKLVDELAKGRKMEKILRE